MRAHHLLTCLQIGHHKGKLGLVLLSRHIVESTAEVILCLGKLVGEHLQSWALPYYAAAIVAFGDPHITVGRVGVGAALEEDQLTRVDGEDLTCPQALARADLQVVGSVCESEGSQQRDIHTQCVNVWEILT